MINSHSVISQNDSTPGSSIGRVLIVEDDQDLRDMVSEYLTRVGFAVTAVGTGLAFYNALANQSYAVAIIDLGLPDMDGLQLAEYVRNNTRMSCIILTARDSVDARISGYDSGADLYMVKPVDCRELASALTRMIQRSAANLNAVGISGEWRLNRQSATLVTPACDIISLTAREMDFLLCLSKKPEDTVPRTSILASLGYANDDFSNRALESLIRRLRRKIEQQNGTAPILTRHGIGYSFSAPILLN